MAVPLRKDLLPQQGDTQSGVGTGRPGLTGVQPGQHQSELAWVSLSLLAVCAAGEDREPLSLPEVSCLQYLDF